MINSKTFEVMAELSSAIKRIDRIKDKGGEHLLENVFITVKEINLEYLSDDIKMNIINDIREGLVQLYQERQVAINKEIGLGISFEFVDREEVEEADEKLFNDNILNNSGSTSFQVNNSFITDLNTRKFTQDDDSSY